MSFVIKNYVHDLSNLEKEDIVVAIVLTLSAGVITAVIYYFTRTDTSQANNKKVKSREIQAKEKANDRAVKNEVAEKKVTQIEPIKEKAEIASKSVTVQEPFLAQFDGATASTLLASQKYTASLLPPFLARYEATTASRILVANEYITSLPKYVEPFLANYEATTASTLLEAQGYVESIPKRVDPFLADYDATAAASLLAASEYVASMPKPASPCLAAYEASTAANLQQAREYIEKLPKPSLAKYEATTAATLLEASEYIQKLSQPFLAEYEATTASCLLAAVEYTCQLSKPPKGKKMAISDSRTLPGQVPPLPTPFLANYEASTAMALKEGNEYIERLPKPFLAHYEASTASHLLQAQAYVCQLTSKKEAPIEPRPVAKAMHSDLLPRSFSASASPFQPSHLKDHIPYPTRPQLMLFSHPDSPPDSEPETTTADDAVFVMANSLIPYDEKAWARAEKIQKQSQNHFPKMKSRCNYWPNCTNKHCKYWHPIKDCRMGQECTFKERCMFLHPADYGAQRKKRPHKQAKRTVSSVF
ncbi:hypothetical protein BY458DRAFT_521206 [Sporodiniella umbellata]|nr:hypothetical protein BY458DRAFT_521206 [Sporodiniella umbellata]